MEDYTFNTNEPESIGKAIQAFERDHPVMDIYSSKGTKVIYTGVGGYDHHKETGDKYLKIGQEYTVEKTEVLDWSTNVYLKEIQDTWPSGHRIYFNSVMFKLV